MVDGVEGVQNCDGRLDGVSDCVCIRISNTYSDPHNPYDADSRILNDNGAEQRPKRSKQRQHAQSKLYLSCNNHSGLRLATHRSPPRLSIGNIVILSEQILSASKISNTGRPYAPNQDVC